MPCRITSSIKHQASSIQYPVSSMVTNKQQILQSALTLFAQQGYDRTPTSQIARAAGVSEGLIFRHYGSKAGLLEAIIRTGFGQIAETMQAYGAEADPSKAIALH